MKTKQKKLVPDTWNVEFHHVSYVFPSGGEYYHIERDRLDEIREECKVFGIQFINSSKWIAQLQGKVWIKKRHLYEMANIIKKQKPNNKIDWNQTYHYIEVRSQLDALHAQMSANNEFE
jgi:hypothetical protein